MEDTPVSPIIERLCKFINYSGLSNSQFADKAGIPRPSLSQMLHGRNKSLNNQVLEKLNSAFPELNVVWLLFGQGSMLQDSNIQFSRAQNSDFTDSEQAKVSNNHTVLEDDIDFNEGLLGFRNSAETLSNVKNSAKSSPNGDFNQEQGEQQTPLARFKSLENGKVNSMGNKKIASIIVLFSDGSFETFVPGTSGE